MHSASTPAARRPSARRRHGIARQPASPSYALRMAWSGEISRTSSSGRSANSTETPTPMPTPASSTIGSSVTCTSSGSTPLRACGSAELDAGPEQRPERRGDEAQRDGLREVDGEHQRALRPEAPQHRDRLELAREERGDPARHADAAEQQRDQADELEEALHVLERLRDVGLRVVGGLAAHPLVAHHARIAIVEKAARPARLREFQQGL